MSHISPPFLPLHLSTFILSVPAFSHPSPRSPLWRPQSRQREGGREKVSETLRKEKDRSRSKEHDEKMSEKIHNTRKHMHKPTKETLKEEDVRRKKKC